MIALIMKNLLILDTGKEWGGGTVSLLELLKRIDRKKFNIAALFYLNYEKPMESNIKIEIEKLGINFLLLENNRKPILAKILKEIGRILLSFNKRLIKLYVFGIDYIFKIKNNAEKISKILKDLNIDLLYMNNQPSSNLEGIIAAKNAGIKSIIHSRCVVDLNFFEINAVNKWLTKTICVSEGLKNSFVQQGIESSKCVVVHNGIDTTITPAITPEKIKNELGFNKSDLLIVSAGSLVKRKCFCDVIYSVAHLLIKHKFEHIKCLIAGQGPEKKLIQKEIDRYNLQDKVILTGFKSDIFSYINASDVFLLTSPKEGFSRVILEAMLMGKPVIAANSPGPMELIQNKETGFLFRAGNIKEIVDCLLMLISSPSLRKSMGEKGRKRAVENFSIEKYANRVGNIFSEVTGF